MLPLRLRRLPGRLADRPRPASRSTPTASCRSSCPNVLGAGRSRPPPGVMPRRSCPTVLRERFGDLGVAARPVREHEGLVRLPARHRRRTPALGGPFPVRRLARPGCPAGVRGRREDRRRHRRERVPLPLGGLHGARRDAARRGRRMPRSTRRSPHACSEAFLRRVRQRLRSHDVGCADRLRHRHHVRPEPRCRAGAADGRPARVPDPRIRLPHRHRLRRHPADHRRPDPHRARRHRDAAARRRPRTRRGSTRSRWARRRSGSAGTRCSRTARSTRAR